MRFSVATNERFRRAAGSIVTLMAGIVLACGGNGGGDSGSSVDPPLIVFSSDRTGSSQLFRMNLDGSDVQQITTQGASEGSISSDRAKVAYMRAGDIFVSNLDGTGEEQLTDPDFYSYRNPVFNHTGTQITYVRRNPGFFSDPSEGIYVMNSDGTDKTVISGAHDKAFDPVFSPDGLRVAYRVWDDNDPFPAHRAMVIVNIDGTVAKTLSTEGDSYPSFSPDGMEILFARQDGLWTMDLDGSNKALLVDVAGSELCASFTPDGKQIVFQSSVSGDNEIYIVNVDGTGLKNLTMSPAASDSRITSLIAP